MMNSFELSCPSAHTDLDTLENYLEDMARASEVLGFEYVVLLLFRREPSYYGGLQSNCRFV